MPVAQFFADQACRRDDKKDESATLAFIKAGIVSDKAEAGEYAGLAHDDGRRDAGKTRIDFACRCAIAATTNLCQFAAQGVVDGRAFGGAYQTVELARRQMRQNDF